MNVRIIWVVVTSAMILTGCRTYVRTDLGDVATGDRVRLHLAEAGMSDLRQLVPGADPVVDGTVVGRTEQDLMVRVPTAAVRTDLGSMPVAQDVRFLTEGVTQIERRQTDVVRTGLAIGVVTIAVGALLRQILSDAFGGSSHDPPIEPQFRVPWIRIPAG